MGYYLRMELLSRSGCTFQLVQELKGWFLRMTQKTGTLWEDKDEKNSCCHGFASHVAHVLYRDVLGCRIDRRNKMLHLRFTDLPLDWCEGRIPLGDKHVMLKWWREGKTLRYRFSAPAGFAVEVNNPDGLDVVEAP